VTDKTLDKLRSLLAAFTQMSFRLLIRTTSSSQFLIGFPEYT